MRWVVLSIGFVAFVVVWSKLFGAPAAPPVWHEGPRWNNFLSLYESFLREMYSVERGCNRARISTSFGETQVFFCGENKPGKSAVLFLHGAASNSMIYGDWILPEVSKTHFSVAVDFLCDVGLSVPRDKNPRNCPQSEAELASWMHQVVTGLNVSSSVSLVGYSYGAFIAAVTAHHHPDLVDKLVLIAPASVLAPLKMAWLARALFYGLFWQGTWFTRYMSAKEDFLYERDIGGARHVEFSASISALSATSLSVNVDVWSDEKLRSVSSTHETLVLVGENETVTDAKEVVGTGKRTGIRVDVLQQAGHLLLIEHPARSIAQERIVEFINS